MGPRATKSTETRRAWIGLEECLELRTAARRRRERRRGVATVLIVEVRTSSFLTPDQHEIEHVPEPWQAPA
jgi:hypothetical protein